ncbi:glycoside hydrolase family 78 protein [Plicaturopsis crispa FD-325 SS-3]|nr:glycoside hydrolase family 78 protein [Plicaturopsis crispa FD-325 SS-3]
MYASLLVVCSVVYACVAQAPAGSWDAFNYAPSSRTVSPVAIHSINGVVDGAQGLVNNTGGNATLAGDGSYVVLDFGKEVGGIVSLHIDQATNASAFSLSFTESPLYISPTESDGSSFIVQTQNSDGVEAVSAPLTVGTFTQPPGLLRGGFRYLTVVSNAADNLTFSNPTVNITFQSHKDNLTAYTGYFSTSDTGFSDKDFLTKLWYGGAYTVQTNTIDVHTARQNGGPAPGWANNATGGPVEGPILVDGAKRDRNVWPGDMGISVHTQLVSTNDLLPTKNSLAVMFSTQDPTTGALAYSGPPIAATGSDTYISWTLIGTHNYYSYTGDLDFVKTVWSNYTKAVAFLEGQVDSTGLMNVPSAFANDWGRDGGAGHNSAANALLYQTLITAADLATALQNTTLAEAYTANATAVKSAYNTLLWDSSAGMFRDNDSSTLHPQDGNSLAVVYNLTTSESQNTNISQGLTAFWTDIGPVSPELNDTIIPFVGGFEAQAHFIAGNGSRALDLLRKEWGYMLYTNISVQSTMLEGFTRNGSLGYRAAAGYDYDYSYTSHSHGWSTGPTPALSFYLLGLKLTSPLGATWTVEPVLSGLAEAEGGYSTSLGQWLVKWQLDGNDLTLNVTSPPETNGTVKLPTSIAEATYAPSTGQPQAVTGGGLQTFHVSLSS